MSRNDRLRQALSELSDLGLDPSTPGGATALEFLLRDTDAPEGERHAAENAGGGDDRPGDPGGIPRLAEWLSIERERVADCVAFGRNGASLSLPVARLPRSKADRQRVLAILKLAADRIGADQLEVPAREVNRVCADYACLDQNLPAHIAARGDLVNRRGRRGAFVYRITQPGLARAKEMFSALLMEDGELRA